MAEIKVTFDDGTVRTFSGSVNRVEEDIDYVERPSSDGRWECYRTGISLLTLEMTCFEKQERPDPDERRAAQAADMHHQIAELINVIEGAGIECKRATDYLRDEIKKWRQAGLPPVRDGRP